jgi:hypothetical protein
MYKACKEGLMLFSGEYLKQINSAKFVKQIIHKWPFGEDARTISNWAKLQNTHPLVISYHVVAISLDTRSELVI